MANELSGRIVRRLWDKFKWINPEIGSNIVESRCSTVKKNCPIKFHESLCSKCCGKLWIQSYHNSFVPALNDRSRRRRRRLTCDKAVTGTLTNWLELSFKFSILLPTKASLGSDLIIKIECKILIQAVSYYYG